MKRSWTLFTFTAVHFENSKVIELFTWTCCSYNFVMESLSTSILRMSIFHFIWVANDKFASSCTNNHKSKWHSNKLFSFVYSDSLTFRFISLANFQSLQNWNKVMPFCQFEANYCSINMSNKYDLKSASYLIYYFPTGVKLMLRIIFSVKPARTLYRRKPLMCSNWNVFRRNEIGFAWAIPHSFKLFFWVIDIFGVRCVDWSGVAFLLTPTPLPCAPRMYNIPQ